MSYLILIIYIIYTIHFSSNRMFIVFIQQNINIKDVFNLVIGMSENKWIKNIKFCVNII